MAIKSCVVPPPSFYHTSHVVQDLLFEITKSFKKLFTEGILVENKRYYCALVGIKGDLDFHKKCMDLQRCYANVGTRNDKELCHLCGAGSSAIPFEDFSESPLWVQSQFKERPWSTEDPPFLSEIPFDSTAPEKVLQLDVFHVHKLGVARDVVGGVLILLLRLGFFDCPGDSRNIDERFKRAHSHFALWCLATSSTPGLRSFTKAFFNMKSLVSAPWASSKGSDAKLLLKWLRHVLRINLEAPVVEGHKALLKKMLQVVDASLKLLLFHSHGLWVERACAQAMYVHMLTALRGYTVLGRESIRLRVRCFILKPKHHSLHHIAMRLRAQLELGATLILSPQCFGCEMNEDFLGRISRLSRRVSFRLVDLRVCERYL